MRVHARTVDAVDRLRHEARIEAVLLGNLLQRVLEGSGVVGRGERVRILEVDLVLTWRHLVVRGFNLDAERLKRVDHVLAHFDALVTSEVKVTGLVVRLGHWVPVGAVLKEEELQLWSHVHLVAELRRALNLAAQCTTWVASEWRTVRKKHIADHARRAGTALGGSPRQNAPRIHVGSQHLIALGDACEALDRRAVEPGAVLDGVRHHVDRDLHALGDAVQVHELQLHGANARLLGLGYGGERRLGFGLGACSIPLRHDPPPPGSARILCVRHRFHPLQARGEAVVGRIGRFAWVWMQFSGSPDCDLAQERAVFRLVQGPALPD